MKSTKKHYLNIKRLAIITLIAILLFSLIGVFRVYATGDTFIITNAEVSEKSNTIDVKGLSFEKTEINSNIIYHKVGDYVKYKITVQNNDSKSYKVVSVSDNNENEFITYDYSDFEGKELKANETADLYVSVKYLKELEDVTKRTQEMNVEINVTLEDYDGNVVTEDIKINSNSPKTGDPITIYMTTAFISALGLIIFATAGKKGKKSYKGKRFYVIIFALVLLTPVTVKAAGNVLTLNFKSVFELNDKVIVKYINTLTGEEEQKIIEYNEKLPIPDGLEKEGYEFLGWFDENGNKVIEDTIITEDTLLQGKFKPIEYTITYNLDYGMVENENPLKYTIESDDITLNKPTRTGYEFTGWTGTDIEQKTKDVKIEKGSIGNREYIANWKAIDYTITYKGLTDAEKTELNNPTSFNIETPNTTLNNPQNRKDTDGDVTESFVGWKENETTSTNITIPAELENKEYEAIWVAVSPNTYTITYDLDGGSLTTENKTSFIKTDTFTLNNPTKTGYTFIGWTGSNGTTPEKEVTIPTGTRKDLNYTANWTKDIYTISYNLEGGTVATTNPSEYTVTSDNITLNNPTRNGYEFAGWTGTDLNSETTSVTISTGSIGNREYTANWTPIEYTITYVLDGGTATNSTSYTIESSNITLNNPIKDGYTFKGWSGTGLTGDTNKEVTIATGSTGNKEYTANWTKNTYTITYVLNGGTNASSNPNTYQVDTETITLAEPTKTGYTFKGWSGTGLTGDTNKEVTITTGSKENKEYTANWTPNTYTIKFHANGGEGEMSDQSMIYDVSSELKANAFTKSNTTFKSWNTKEDGTGESYDNRESVSNLTTTNGATIDLYAQWGQPTKYAVQIYGINQDVDSSGNTLGLTFGPATGADYNNAYVTHEYEEIAENPGNYNVKIVTHTVAANGSETTSSAYLTNSSGNNVTRTQAQVTARENISLHDMTWAEIAAVSDKTVFEDCMLCGDTKSVSLTLNSTITYDSEVYNQYGDGAGTLVNTINAYYREWNPRKRENSYVGTGVTLDSSETSYGSNARNAGGYSVSHIRATLIGKNEKTNEGYAGDVNLTNETCLYSCIESDLQAVITPKKIKYVTGTSTSNYSLNDDIADSIWLFSAREMYGTGKFSGNTTEGLGASGDGYNKFGNTESKYYISSYSTDNNTNRVAYTDAGSAAFWWLRSPCLVNTYYTRYVESRGTINNVRYASDFYCGLAFGFCIQ